MKILNIQSESNSQSSARNKYSLIISIFFASLAGYSYFAFLPFWLNNSKGFSKPEITLMMMFMGVGMAIFSWFFGKISDKTGHRKLFFIMGLFFQVILLALFYLYTHIIYYCILNFFRGFLLGMRMPASSALFAEIVEKKNLNDEINVNNGIPEISGTQLSLLSATKSAGWTIGVLLSSSIINIFGVDSLILFLVIITIISLIFALPIKDVKKEDILSNESEIESVWEEGLINDKKKKNIKDVRKGGKIKSILFVSVFFRQFGVIAFLQMLSILLIEDAGMPIPVAGVLIALNPLFQVVAMIVNGKVIDNPRISERTMLGSGFVLSALTLFCYAGGFATGSIVLFVIGQVSLGFSWGCVYTGGFKYIVNRAPQDRAFYMGIWITNLQVAKISSYLVFAFLWITFTPIGILPYAALIPLVGLVIVFWL